MKIALTRLSLSWSLALACLTGAPTHARDLPGPPGIEMPERLTQARAAIQASDWRAAISSLLEAASVEPANADVHNLLGYAYRKQAQPDLARAMEHYRLALRFDPAHRGAHEYIGEAYLMQDQLEPALRHLADLERLCGNRQCEEYADLAKAVADYRARRR